MISIKRIGIIGLGVISKYYKKALEVSPFLSLCAVCDVNTQAVSKDVYSEYPFYTDYIQMIEKEKLQYVVIATQPIIHYEIAKECINRGVSVIVEKPASIYANEYEELIALAKEKDVVFDVLYHFQTAPEMIGFNEMFDAQKISSVDIQISDPYSFDGENIVIDRQSLCGAWLDSGVNAISMLKSWFPFENVQLISTDVKRCKATKNPIYVKVILAVDGVDVNIVVDWRKQINNKTTFLVYDGKPMILNSSEQKIVYERKEYNFAKMDRLQAHYYNYFKNYEGEGNEQNNKKINDILLFVNEKL